MANSGGIGKRQAGELAEGPAAHRQGDQARATLTILRATP